MPVTLFDNGHHKVMAFTDLVTGDGVQANQFLIIHGDHCALIDPGGDLTYTPLSIELSRHISIADLDLILASHQDPDIIASLPRWLTHTKAKVAVSRLWQRFLPHLASEFVTKKTGKGVGERIIPIADQGEPIRLGDTEVLAVPAHFMHSVGNFSFYDPVSKILFSGDIGAAVGAGRDDVAVTDFKQHTRYMEGFHKRYMASNRACLLWVDEARKLDISMIVPQHGPRMEGDLMIKQFLGWIGSLSCGIDLLEQHRNLSIA